MRHTIFLSLLFLCLQLFLCFEGVNYFGRFINPLILLASFIGLFVVYLETLRNVPEVFTTKKNNRLKLWAFAGGIIAVVLCFPAFNHAFHIISDPGTGSDVVPQLETQYDRFRQGIMPYRQMNLYQSKPFPVYMPLHWLPVGISRGLGIDARWSGLLLLAPAAGLCCHVIAGKKMPVVLRIVCLALFPAVLLSALYGGDHDLPLSLETTVAAYYLVLAAGLLQRNLVFVTVGLALCLLSRYTLIFWMPVFLFLLISNKGWAKTGRIAIALIAAFCCVYVIPFLLKDPSIFIHGLKYHNGAAEFEWKYGQGTFFDGIYFAPHIDALVEGSYTHKVFVARICQALTMLSLCTWGIWYYRRIKNKVDFYDYSLGMLYLFLVGFYMIGPLTYRYYMLTPLLLSAVLCIKIIGVAAKTKAQPIA